MSQPNPFGIFSGSTSAIYHDSSENLNNPAFRKDKKENMQGKQPVTKRAALGTITNTTRVQPFRATKQGTKTTKSFFGSLSENSLQDQPFSIHVDKESCQGPFAPTFQQSQVSSSEKLELHPALTAVRPPLTTLHETIVIDDQSDASSCSVSDSELEESPMHLDSSIVDHSRQIEDTPESRFEKILNVPDYCDDIYKYLLELEAKHMPKPGYMKKQPDITNSMRSILVDWLVEVSEEYKLHRETLCLSVNYIDRFLSQMSVLRGKLQLVGAACVYLAAKFEEIYPPEVGEFVYITDDTYTKKQVLRMEHLVLKVLSFDCAMPTVNCFCERFLKAVNADEKLHSLSMYLAELTLVDSDPFLKYLPSVIAATSLCLANITLNKEDIWPESMVELSGYKLEDLQACLKDLYTTFCRAPHHPQQAIREKYKQSKYQQVSLLCPPPSLPVPAQSQ